MDPVVIKVQVEVVPAEEIGHLQLRNAKLQANYEELLRLYDALRASYSELLMHFGQVKKDQRALNRKLEELSE